MEPQLESCKTEVRTCDRKHGGLGTHRHLWSSNATVSPCYCGTARRCTHAPALTKTTSPEPRLFLFRPIPSTFDSERELLEYSPPPIRRGKGLRGVFLCPSRAERWRQRCVDTLCGDISNATTDEVTELRAGRLLPTIPSRMMSSKGTRSEHLQDRVGVGLCVKQYPLPQLSNLKEPSVSVCEKASEVNDTHLR